MDKKIRKCIRSGLIGLSLIGNVLPAFSNHHVYAEYVGNEENKKNILQDIQNYVDENIIVENGKIVLKNKNDILNFVEHKLKYMPDLNRDEMISRIDALMAEFNSHLNSNQENPIYLTEKGYAIGFTSFERSSSHIVTYHWYGIRHEFTNDRAALDFANNFEQMSAMGTGGAAAGSLIFPAGWVPTVFLAAGSTYSAMIVETIRHNADKPGDGVIFIFNHWSQFSCYSR